jgi:amino acid transporter
VTREDRDQERPPVRSDPPALSLEERRRAAGKLPGDRYVRIVRPAAREFKRSGGHYVATEEALLPKGVLARRLARLNQFLFGQRLEESAEQDQRVSKVAALGVLAPSNVSSSAYATEEAMRALALAGVAALTLTLPVALAIVGVLALIVASESRVIRTYPHGGGAYVVARDNVGVIPGLVAAAALLIDYTLTVAVSTAAGVVAISSFVPELAEHRVLLGVGLIVLLAIGHVRGVREAGALFALPTYAYIGTVLALIGYGALRIATGDVPAPVAPRDVVETTGVEALTILVVLRAFAGGAAALTGSEAVANVVPSFKPPETRNAVLTLGLMTGTLAVLFLGLTFLAVRIGIVPDAGEIESVNSMVARSVFGDGSLPYLAVQVTTALFLLIAANTGFSGFPRLAFVLANDRFMPRQFAFRGERLSYSFGILALAMMAATVYAVFNGSVSALVPLYTIAVFLAFFLSQLGLLRRTLRSLEASTMPWLAVHAAGATVMGALVIAIAVLRFREAGAILLLVPFLVLLLLSINRHYRAVHDALVLPDLDAPLPPLEPPAVIVPVARLDRATVQAIAFARSISPHVRAVHVATSSESAEAFRRRWEKWSGKVPIDVIESPYRSLVRPLLRYIERVNERDPRPLTVVLAEFVPRHWWEFILHSQTAFRLKAALLFRPNTIVIDVPYHFKDTGDVTGARPEGATPRK